MTNAGTSSVSLPSAGVGPEWGAEALRESLSPLLPNLSVEVAASLTSTNTVLLERARTREPVDGPGQEEAPAGVRRSIESGAFARRPLDWHPCLLVAERQTAGRGRLGRQWHAEALASLSFSLALPMAPASWSGLSLAVGVALADALDPQPAGGRPRIGLKWPNDLWLLDDAGAPAAAAGNGIGRKLGGILIETLVAGPRRLAVIGIGLNVRPLLLSDGEAQHGVACLQEIESGLEAPEVLRRVALPLVQALLRFEREGFAPFAPAFSARDLLLGRGITTTLPDLAVGTACGVAADGCLLVDGPAGRVSLHSGEVSVRPAASVTEGLQC